MHIIFKLLLTVLLFVIPLDLLLFSHTSFGVYLLEIVGIIFFLCFISLMILILYVIWNP